MRGQHEGEKRKRRMEAFSFYDHTGIAAHLEQMAQKGWMLEEIGNYFWVYRRIQPRKVHFAVTYYPKASAFDPDFPEEQQEFHEFCGRSGWRLAASSAQMQIFCNEGEDPLPIETDPQLEVDTLHRAAKRSYLPVYGVLLALAAVMGGLFVGELLTGDAAGLLADGGSLFSGWVWLLLLLLCAVEVGGYLSWHRRAKRAAQRGEFLPTSSHKRLQLGILVLVLVSFACWLLGKVLAGTALGQVSAVLGVLYMAVLILLVNGVKRFLKREGASARVNRTATFAASFLLAFVLLYAITSGVVWSMNHGLLETGMDIYAGRGEGQAPGGGTVPLTMEELLGESMEGYVLTWREEASPFVAQAKMQEFPGTDMDNYQELPSFQYTLTEVKLPILYGLCKRGLLNERKDEVVDGEVVLADHYEPSDPKPWGAEEAYRLYWSGGCLDKYLLCYGSRLVEISFDWEPAPEQMAAVGERLGG